jgi:hypothetical protein
MSEQPCSPDQVSRVTCYRTHSPIQLDGTLSSAAWQKAPRSPRFVDMVNGAPGLYDTRMSTLWDNEYLYVGYWIEDPQLEAHLTQRDATIFQESDVEVFIDGGDAYYEFEINALGTIYEVFFIWRDAYTRGSRFDVPAFDLFKAFSFGGNFDRDAQSFWHGTHPRGLRWAFLDYDFPGLRSAVHVDGILNQETRGWTVELAFPWSGMTWLANGRAVPPQPGDVWRMFFGRFQKLMTSGQELNPHPAWVLSKHGEYDTHQPDCWPLVEFSGTAVEDL